MRLHSLALNLFKLKFFALLIDKYLPRRDFESSRVNVLQNEYFKPFLKINLLEQIKYYFGRISKLV